MELDVCEIYQIRHSEFLGWDADDRDKAIAHQVRKAQRCGSCGTHPEEWDPAVGGTVDAYKAKFTHCRGCQELEAANDRLEKSRQGTEKPRRGTTVKLVRNQEA